MQVSSSPTLPDGPYDALAVVIAEGAGLPEAGGDLLAAAIERGEARTSAGHVAHLHDGDSRIIVVGVGAADEVDGETLRVAAAHSLVRAEALGATQLTWVVPTDLGGGSADGSDGDGSDADDAEIELAGVATGAIVEGVLLRDWRYPARRKTPPTDEHRIARLVVVGGDQAAVTRATVVAESANWAKLQQHEPPNVLTPTELGKRAKALVADTGCDYLKVQVEGREEIAKRNMGMLLSVAQGSDVEPALITMRYRHPGARGARIGLVGKAVTFDSGGISIKPSGGMHEMKFDMSGGAAMLGVMRAVALLDLPLDIVCVVGATENMPSGHAVKPGDIVTAADGTTVEITNTDAEGRLVLGDCVLHARHNGAELLVDAATLTGAVTVALGSTFAGLVATDDALADELLAAGVRTGELAWRLPMHPEFAKLMKSADADMMNGALERKAGTITGAYFISRFAGDVPWAHLDIAGTAWKLGRAYSPRGGSAYGLRLLVDWLRSRD
jgi:leucyl aminopeptidase